MVLVLCEMQSVSSRIWTRVSVSISDDDNHYTTGTSVFHICSPKLVTTVNPLLVLVGISQSLSRSRSFPHRRSTFTPGYLLGSSEDVVFDSKSIKKKPHEISQQQTQPRRTTSKMVERAQTGLGYFLCHLDPDIRK